MKKLALSILILSSLLLTGCGFTGCGDPCGASSSYAFRGDTTNCCSALPW